ncbi:hypothetical protein Poli38472_003459 [Pythium oligandrum]|uniref:Phospholipase A-2-activating protein n=1 Tax=Pythium oligandrum TaxID=41045 RepID=A0A8K1C6K2_PYTOL|nr:hypothetical protein Poli38472_003459 [Pythium oligandrum]|eukprot:TMW57534.1 hypothetical protein Poli38472_003459 [Pythium oligandrum]
MTTTDALYRLQSELQQHEGAVRSICVLDNDVVVTGAMDTTVLSWIRDPSDNSYGLLPTATIYGHEHWVTALAKLPPNVLATCPSGGFVTGCMDKAVRVYDLEGNLISILRGHEGGVISLGFTADYKYLLSGSWDGTARVWDLATMQCVHVLEGHENGVCVLGLPNGVVVTGSTGRQEGNTVVDFQLRFWTNFTLTNTRRDHTGPIRQLALLPDVGFVSCSNDGSVRVRTLDGEVVAAMQHPLNAEGKPGFILGVAVLSDNRIVSASEDCTARVWGPDGSLLQTIEHPGGLWCVTATPNGGFITGCDDKTARVFTSDPALASATAQATFEAAVEEARLVRARGPSGVEVAKLPDYDQRINVVGKSDGQIQMFRKGTSAWACQWSGPSKTWVDIGEVTGTGSGGVVDGKAYDMVIPVELDQPGGAGVRHLEIGYNQGDNPFQAAQEFIDKHMLDQNYLREIADYITQRSSDYRPPVIEGAEDMVDIPAESSPTGPTYKFFPVRSYSTFETIKIAKLMSTVRQFNDQVPETDKLSEQELNELDQIAKTVQDTQFYHSSTFTVRQVEALKSVTARWATDHVFPVLDLLRLVLVHPQGPPALGNVALEKIVTRALHLGVDPSTSVPNATRMLSLRVLANLFYHKEGRAAILSKKDEILSHIMTFSIYYQKTIALSLATLVLNISRLSVETPEQFTSEDLVTIGSSAMELLNGAPSLEDIGEDTVLRSLVAVGSVTFHADQDVKNAMAALLTVFFAAKAHEIKSPSLQECVEELKQCVGLV